MHVKKVLNIVIFQMEFSESSVAVLDLPLLLLKVRKSCSGSRILDLSSLNRVVGVYVADSVGNRVKEELLVLVRQSFVDDQVFVHAFKKRL